MFSVYMRTISLNVDICVLQLTNVKLKVNELDKIYAYIFHLALLFINEWILSKAYIITPFQKQRQG